MTAWYLLIIMLISGSFSVVMYNLHSHELDRVEQAHRARQNQFFILRSDVPPQSMPRHIIINADIIEEAKNRLKTMLILINLGILGTSSVVGYFLAGRTLKPIQTMVDEQNRFITDASHELRTPITSLRTEIEVNLRDKKVSKDARKLLESNLEDVKNLQMLSDNLIKLTQYQNTARTAFTSVALKDVIDDACQKVANLAKHKKITIENSVREYALVANKQSLTEAFVILLDNAIKYSPNNASVIVGSKPMGQSVVVVIKDEGIGIDKEDIPHLFDRFYRADTSRTKKDVEGFGLGLSIAKQIIDNHHGTISVKSTVGKGSTFSIQLPRKQ